MSETTYAARLDSAKAAARTLFLETGPLTEDAVSEIAETHSTLDLSAPWRLNDFVEMDSDLAEFVFSAYMSAEGIPVR